jgi:hypothetical protein
MYIDKIDKAEDLRRRYETRKAEIQALALLWKSLLPAKFLPGGRQFSIWIDRYGFELTEKGIRLAAVKFNVLESKAKRERNDSIAMSQDHCVRYASAVMVKCAAQLREAANA